MRITVMGATEVNIQQSGRYTEVTVAHSEPERAEDKMEQAVGTLVDLAKQAVSIAGQSIAEPAPRRRARGHKR